MHYSMHFIFFRQCAHFNALYFRNERAEQLLSAAFWAVPLAYGRTVKPSRMCNFSSHHCTYCLRQLCFLHSIDVWKAVLLACFQTGSFTFWKVFQIGTVRYNWPMSAHASQAFSIAHCTDSEDLPTFLMYEIMKAEFSDDLLILIALHSLWEVVDL